LREETSVQAGYLEQLGAFGHPDRDPRERVITVAYIALVPFDRLRFEAGSDAADAKLFAIDDLPELAFDHSKILRRAKERLRDKLDIADIVRQLMPDRFTLSELQRTHEAISNTESDKRNFRKKLKTLEIVEATGENKEGGAHRPARLYRAVKKT